MTRTRDARRGLGPTNANKVTRRVFSVVPRRESGEGYMKLFLPFAPNGPSDDGRRGEVGGIANLRYDTTGIEVSSK